MQGVNHTIRNRPGRVVISALLAMVWLISTDLAAQSERGWQLSGSTPDPTPVWMPFDGAAGAPLGAEFSPLIERPRLSVALRPSSIGSAADGRPRVSLSLDAWHMNTASLAHIQCSRAVRTMESFLVENCRFVDQPLPSDSANLVQVQGRWMATPNLSFGIGAYTGRQPLLSDAPSPLASVTAPGSARQVQGVNVSLSFGMDMGQIGDLLLDLQLERFRERPDSLSAQRNDWVEPPIALGLTALSEAGADHRNAGRLGLGWRGERFGANLTGEYQELPQWTGEDAQGAGFHSFDLEFSWRSLSNSSFSIGVSNVLDRLPGEAVYSADRGVEEAVDGIYGRIPYVRYKHDL